MKGPRRPGYGVRRPSSSIWVVGALQKAFRQEGGMVTMEGHSGYSTEQRDTGAREARELSGTTIQVKGW